MNASVYVPRIGRSVPRIGRLLTLIFCLTLTGMVGHGSAEEGGKRHQGKGRGQSQPLAEYQVKAAFILKFASFIQWPEGSGPVGSGPIEIAVLGVDPFGDLLPADIPADGGNGEPFRVTRLRSVGNDLERFQMIFLSRLSPDLSAPLLERVDALPILTIGEGEEFAGKGGIIAFMLENNRVRFQVNLKQAQKVGLKISSQLLNLARSVIR